MATIQPQPNIWAQMSYTPPRGPCSLKTSIVSTCTCYRFMVHPLKAGTSFDCDGCGHHASFHRMESREEEEVVRRWKAAEEELDIVEERERARARERTGMGMIEGVGRAEEITTVVVGPGKKRRMIGGGGGQRDVVVEIDGEDEDEGISLNRNDRAGVTGGRKRKGRS